MTAPFMRAYSLLLVKTCHARGAHAIGGMAAFVPSRSNEEATAAALDKTTADKAREAGDGFDGSWVAHPALVATCTEAFNQVLGEAPNQLGKQRPDVLVSAEELTDVSGTPGSVSLDGVRTNLRVSLEYLAAWVGGQGAVAIDNLMEDAATVEISRMQVWQWLRHQATTADGMTVNRGLVRSLLDEECARLTAEADVEVDARVSAARDIIEATALVDDWPPFFTNYAYDRYLAEAR
jgi:malate synthase